MKTYLRHRILNVIDVKELIALEYLDFEGKYKDYVETHDFWELCYVESGQITLVLEGEGLAVSTGELVLIAPDKKHSYVSAKGNENKAFVVCFESSSQSLKSLAGTRFLLDEIQLDCLKKIVWECKYTFRMNENELLEVVPSPNFGGQQAILLQLEYLLICLLRRLSGEENAEVVFLSGEKFYADLVGVIVRFFRENIRAKLSLEDVCNKVNYSRSFLCKTFKEQTGETLFACFNRLKIEEAKRLLEDTRLSVGDISRELGFSEVKYFGALFKKLTGETPVAYREGKR